MGLALIALEAGFTLVAAPVLPRIGAWSYSAATCAVAAVIFLALGLITDPFSITALAGPAPVLAAVYLGAVATSTSFVLWFSCVQRIGAGVAGLTAGTAAPSAALVGTLVGIPAAGWPAWLGMVTIIAGLLIGLPKRAD
jgi:drug/metabolite transporter (DMT)-like permease